MGCSVQAGEEGGVLGAAFEDFGGGVDVWVYGVGIREGGVGIGGGGCVGGGGGGG